MVSKTIVSEQVDGLTGKNDRDTTARAGRKEFSVVRIILKYKQKNIETFFTGRMCTDDFGGFDRITQYIPSDNTIYNR